MKYKLCLLLLLSFSSLFASSAALDLNRSQAYIGTSIALFEDSSAALDFEQITKLPANSFIPFDKAIFSHAFTPSAFWYTFELNNSQTAPLSRLLVFEAPWLDHINIHILSPQGKHILYELGNTLPFNNRSINHPFINQNHTFEPGLSHVYVQVKTRDPFVFAASVLDENDFLLEQITKSKLIGLVYGILLAMALYNLLIFIGIKEPYFAYYVLFVFVFLFMNASYNGYIFQNVLYDAPQLQNWLNSIFLFLFSLTYLLFTKSFLNLKIEHQKLNNATKKIIYSLLLIALISALAGGYRLHIMLSIIAIMLVSLYIFAIAIYSWFHGNRSARLFILGSIGGLSGSITTSLTVMGQIPYSYIAYKAVDFGMLIDAVLLSLALADRIKLTREEKNIAEMERTIAEAEALLAQNDSRTDVLTGLMNRRAYYEIGEKESNRSNRYHMQMSIIIIDIDNFKQFNDNYGHDMGDRVLKHFAEVLMRLKRDSDYAFRLGGDEFMILLPQTNKHEAHAFAERLQEEVSKSPLHYEGTIHPINISCGVSQDRTGDRSIDQIQKRADRALYKAKDSGKNETVSCS